jgi:hypothetical protein
MVLGNTNMTRSPAERMTNAAVPASERSCSRHDRAGQGVSQTIGMDPASPRQNRPFYLTQTTPRSSSKPQTTPTPLSPL